jgi:hypothetical protein
VVWAERGGRVHAYDLRRAEARMLEAKSEGEALEAVDMSPPKPPGAAGGHAVAGAVLGAFALLGEDEDERNGDAGAVAPLTEAQVASMDPETRRARVEKTKRESAALARRLQHWPAAGAGPDLVPGVPGGGPAATAGHHRAQLLVLRELHRLANELEMLRGKAGAAERRFVQTVRRRVRGVYVTGVCAVTAPAPPRPKLACGKTYDTNENALGPASLQTRPPPHDLVFVGVPSGVLRFRAPTAWLPDYNHLDFPPAFRAAARAFLTCAEADTRRGTEPKSVSLGDMPREVLLRVLALAAVPISDWIDEQNSAA